MVWKILIGQICGEERHFQESLIFASRIFAFYIADDWPTFFPHLSDRFGGLSRVSLNMYVDSDVVSWRRWLKKRQSPLFFQQS
jgi:hypothetical protein